MEPLLNLQFLPKPPPTPLPRATRTASSLLVSSTFNLPPKSKLLSLHLFLPLPSLMCFKPRLTRARRDSLMAPLSMDRRRGMLECPSPSDSAISSREATRSQISARAADLLACPPHLLDKNFLSCSFQPGLTRVPLGTDARHFVRCRKGLRLHGAVGDTE